MKSLIFVAAIASNSAYASDFESIALERLSFELTTASSNASKIESYEAYLQALERLGATPTSSHGCLSSALIGVAGNSCKSIRIDVRSGGSTTGGAE